MPRHSNIPPFLGHDSGRQHTAGNRTRARTAVRRLDVTAIGEMILVESSRFSDVLGCSMVYQS